MSLFFSCGSSACKNFAFTSLYSVALPTATAKLAYHQTDKDTQSRIGPIRVQTIGKDKIEVEDKWQVKWGIAIRDEFLSK